MRNKLIFLVTIKLVTAPVWAQSENPPSIVGTLNSIQISQALQSGLNAYQKGDYPAALKHLISLANSGNAAAQLQLGTMNELGQGVPPNAQRAVAQYRQAAELGNAEAQYRLGEKYELGEGVAQDKKAAARWYEKSAAQGNSKAKAKLNAEAQSAKLAVAAELAYWNNVKAKQAAEAKAKEEAEALATKRAIAAELAYWNKIKETQQSATATQTAKLPAKNEFQLGLEAYQKGDYPAALERLIPLANKGDAAAQLQLGIMNEQGQGVPKNAQRAVLRYRQAAELGNAEAQFLLGEKYHLGLGIAQDKKTAMLWLKKSAGQGYEKARDFIDEETNKAEHIRLAAEANERAAKAAVADEQAKQAAALKHRAEAEQARLTAEAKAVAKAEAEAQAGRFQAPSANNAA